MIAEAIDTAITLGWALAAWIVVLAAAGTIVLLAAAAAVALAVRGAWRGLAGAWRALQAFRVHGEGRGASVASEGRSRPALQPSKPSAPL